MKFHFPEYVYLHLIGLVLCNVVHINTFGQNILKLNINHKDPFEVELVSRINHENNRLEFYYLPVNLRVSINQESQPELLFMAWNTENQSSAQGILHWILTWGLTATQEEEVQKLLINQVDSSAILLGALSVQAASHDFTISGTNDSMLQILSTNITSGTSIPTSAGSKSATSFKFSGATTMTILSSLKNTNAWKQVFIEMPFYFNLPSGETRSKVLKLEAKTIFKQLLTCKECFKLI